MIMYLVILVKCHAAFTNAQQVAARSHRRCAASACTLGERLQLLCMPHNGV
jgi:hypothetical protein